MIIAARISYALVMDLPAGRVPGRPRVIVTSNRQHFAQGFASHLRRELPECAVELVMADSAAELEAELNGIMDESLSVISALIVIGGDGMVHIGANVLAGGEVPKNIPLGIIPAGSGNDFVRSVGTHIPRVERLNMPAMATRAARSIHGNSVRRVDAMRVTGAWGSRVVMGVVNAGVDAIVNQRANSLKFPRGRAKYLVALTREWRSLKPRQYRFEVTDCAGSVRSGSTTAWLASVGNAQYIGGGMKILPDAELDDGALDFGIIRPLTFREFAVLFPRIFSGKHASHEAMVVKRVRKVTIETANITAFGDGEALGTMPITVEVMRRAVSILV